MPATTTVTLTGAGGFIGGRVAAHLLRALAPTDRLRLLVHRTRPALATAELPPYARESGAAADSGLPEVETLPGDLTDPGSLRGLCAGSDLLVHCASAVGGPEEACRAVNSLGTDALLAEARRCGVRRIVHVGTASVYGRGTFRDARPADLPLAPGSAASRTRAEAERSVLAAGGTVLRPHLVYGTGDRWVGPGLLRLARRLGGSVDGWPARLSLVEVNDLARAVAGAALAPAGRGTAGVYHANHPVPVTVADLLGALAAATGTPLPANRLTAAEARARLAGRTHDLDMVLTDHAFDSRPLWRDFALPAGPGFPARLAAHADWYARQAASD